MEQQSLIGATDAAELLGVSTNTVALAVRQGRLPVVARIGGKRFLVFDRQEIMEHKVPGGGIKW